MSSSAIQDQKALAREMFVQKTVHGNALVSAGAHPGDTISTIKSREDSALDPISENGLYERADLSLLPISRVDVTKLIRALRQFEGMAKRQSPRIAFKAKGRILFVELAEIVAVQAEGNYISLIHRPNPVLLRESISSIAEKLKPYGFIRIHRSVVVNISAVEEIQPLPTGEYRLRVRDGKQYMVTRTYKDNLRDLAQLWVGSERIPG
jgi:two-component system LytT family response regulator